MADGSVMIPVYFHVIRIAPGSLTNGDIPETSLDSLITIFNANFGGAPGGVDTPFRFYKAAVERTTNSDWFFHMASNPTLERQVKTALRVGGPRALNIYSVITPDPGAIAWAAYPWRYAADRIDDGIVADYQIFPGGNHLPYNMGRSITHEVGHWLGLYHTFEPNDKNHTGDCSDVPGDRISDTPVEGMPSSTCNNTVDSCPGGGVDSIHNYMNYTDDSCKSEFTPMQRERMEDAWITWRKIGMTGLALTGGTGWASLPNAIPFDGQFVVANPSVIDANGGNFAEWASGGTPKLAGDFDGDGRTDIALTGPSSWGSVPIAYANGNQTFDPRNIGISSFPGWSATSGVTRLVGDFDGDGRSDIALTGVSGWTTIRMAWSMGRGSLAWGEVGLTTFASRSAQANVVKLLGDFNRDGRADIALVGGSLWTSIRVATGAAGRLFTYVDQNVLNKGATTTSQFGTWATQSSAKLVGDFNGDGADDIALLGGTNWGSIPVAFSKLDATFEATNISTQIGPLGLTTFNDWARLPGVEKLVADVNGDGKSDILLIGGSGWASIPCAISLGDGSFLAINVGVTSAFGAKAATAGVSKIIGDFDSDGMADIALLGGSGWAGSIPVAYSNGAGSFTAGEMAATDPGFTEWAVNPAARFAGSNFLDQSF